MSHMAELSAAVFSTASDAIIATDSDGVITFWNPGAARIFGFQPMEAIGRSVDIIIPESLQQRIAMAATCNGGKTVALW